MNKMHRMIIGPDSQGILSILLILSQLKAFAYKAFCRLNNKRDQKHIGQIGIAFRALQAVFGPVFWL